MRVLSLQTRSEIYLAACSEVGRRLAADPVTAHLAEWLREADAELKTCHVEWTAAHEATGARVLELKKADEAQDDKVCASAHILAAKVHNNHESLLWVSHFPRGYRAITHAPLADEERAVVALAGIFARDTDPDLQAQAPVLTDAAARTRACLDAWRTTRMNEEAAYRGLQVAKIHFNQALRRVHGELRNIFKDDVRKAESYVDVAPKRHRVKAPAEAQPAPPAAA